MVLYIYIYKNLLDKPQTLQTFRFKSDKPDLRFFSTLYQQIKEVLPKFNTSQVSKSKIK